MMDEFNAYRTRKDGNYTPNDVLKNTKEVIEQHGAEKIIVIVQTKDDRIRRYNTQMDNVELTGLLEVAKILEFTD